MHREADDEPNDIKYRESIQDIGAAAMLSALLTSKTSKFVNVNVNVVPLLTASRVQDTGDALKQQLPLQYYCYYYCCVTKYQLACSGNGKVWCNLVVAIMD